MDSVREKGDLNFGPRLQILTDGSIVSQSSKIDYDAGESPLQLRRPPPIGMFDLEPVVIPVGHPLAASTPKKSLEKKTDQLVDQTEKLEEMIKEAREAMRSGWLTMASQQKQLEDEVNDFHGIVDGIEGRILKEAEDIKRFKTICDQILDDSTRTSQKLYVVSQELEMIERQRKKHEKTALNLRLTFNAAHEVKDVLTNMETVTAMIRETNMDEACSEKPADIAELSTALFEVQETLSKIRYYAPSLLKSPSSSLSRLVEDVLFQMRSVDSAVLTCFSTVPPDAVPPPTFSTASTISTVSTVSMTSTTPTETEASVHTSSTQLSDLLKLQAYISAESENFSDLQTARAYESEERCSSEVGV